jgi:hypothetical protein
VQAWPPAAASCVCQLAVEQRVGMQRWAALRKGANRAVSNADLCPISTRAPIAQDEVEKLRIELGSLVMKGFGK